MKFLTNLQPNTFVSYVGYIRPGNIPKLKHNYMRKYIHFISDDIFGGTLFTDVEFYIIRDYLS